jgi:type II secretory pathway component GspD/PulD (secretin)
MNGQTALLSVGQDRNYISKIETTTTAGTTPITTFSVNTSTLLSGVMIGIVPFISESGEISLNVTPITSDLVKIDSQQLGTPDSAGNYPFLIQLPTINLRQMNTTVKVRNGHMVIIGGLIANREEYTDSQIPWLGDIPILGYFFKSRSKTVIKTELVILLQPVIISK